MPIAEEWQWSGVFTETFGGVARCGRTLRSCVTPSPTCHFAIVRRTDRLPAHGHPHPGHRARSGPARRPAEHRPHRCPPTHKLEWIHAAYAAGLREIEVGSFVPARLLPQLADTAELVRAARKTLPGLVDVGAGAQPARAPSARSTSGADLMLLPLSASHAHSLANLRKTPDEVVAEIGRIRAARDAAGSRMPDRSRHQHRLRLHDPGPGRRRTRCCAWCRRCSTPASTASAWPTPSAMPIRARCARLFERCFAVAGDRLGCGHFHDTRGLGLANVYAALAGGRAPLRRLPRRHRRLPARARRQRQRRHRRPGLPVRAAWASPPASTSTS